MAYFCPYLYLLKLGPYLHFCDGRYYPNFARVHAVSLLFWLLRIVCSYLRHYGYEDTLKSLNMATQGTVSLPDQANGCDEADIAYGLSQRRTLRQVFIYNGI